MNGSSVRKKTMSSAATSTTSSFPCGTTIAPDGDTLRLYYGAADTSIAMATGSIRAMLQRLENTPEGNKRFEDMMVERIQ